MSNSQRYSPLKPRRRVLTVETSIVHCILPPRKKSDTSQLSQSRDLTQNPAGGFQGGFYRRGCQVKTLSRRNGQEHFGDIQPLSPSFLEEGFLLVASAMLESSQVIPAVRFLSPASRRVVGANHGSIGDSPGKSSGTIALLGYPRGHMVAGETQCRSTRRLTSTPSTPIW